ncbi:MAG: hypothetical protein U0183_13770 [Polyangiaceae bacterium]
MRHVSFFAVLALGTGLFAACSGGTTSPEADAGLDASADASPPVEPCADAPKLRAGTDCETPFPERIEGATTIARGCYRVKKTPVLAAGAALTVSPGTTLLFAKGAGLDVSENRKLVAKGTREAPICLTGEKAERGAWDGLTLGRTEAGPDVLEHLTVEYAGDTTSDRDAAGIKVASDSRAVNLAMTHTTVRESQGAGLYLVGSATFAAFSENTFTKNALAANVDANVVGYLDAASRFTGNDVDEVRVRPVHATKNLAWHAIGVPFHVVGNLNVDGAWSLEAPSTIVVAADSWISVNGDAGALTAIGTADKPIVFTGETKTRGAWDSLRFDNSKNVKNRLEHVTVEYGGSTAHDKSGACLRATADSHGVTLGLTNVTTRECQGFGMFLAGSTELVAFAKNTFTKNGLGPASVGSQAVHQLDVTSTYTGNDVDRLHVRDDRVGKAVTWNDLGVPYELAQSLHVDLVWTLAPGVTLLLAKDTWISIDGDASGLHAVGTAQKPVTFSGLEKTPGYWHALRFGGSLNPANAIENAVVEYGGSTGGGGEEGMITASSDSHGVKLSVKSTTVRHSAQYGIWLGKFAQVNADIDSANTFTANTKGDVYKQP